MRFSALMKRLILFVLLQTAAAQACLWVDGTTMDGRIVRASGINLASWLRQALQEQPGDEIYASRFIHERQRHTDSPDVAAEREAVQQILNGQLKEAIQKLNDLEQQTPGRYSTAANLGTAYELAGDNEAALKWINTGIERNPEGHYGTEWLHSLILEAKIEAARHPQQLFTQRLIEVPDRIGRSDRLMVRGVSREAGDILRALNHQLRERLVFVKPRDPLVADLLYSAALLEASLDTVEIGKEVLALAEEYGFPDQSLLQRQRERFDGIIRTALIWRWIKIAAAILAVLWLIWYGFKKKWLFLTPGARRAYKAAKAAGM